MLQDLSRLLDDPLLLAFILVIGATLGISVDRFVDGMNKSQKKAYWQGRNDGKRKGQVRPITPIELTRTKIAADQLETVMRASFKARALLNKPERRLLAVLDKVLEEECPGWRAMGQVSLGEILASDDTGAFLAINSKRVDLLIVDANCLPLHAIEFQGGGHYMGLETSARDATKKEALRRAGIGYVEIVAGDTPAEVREMVRKMARRVGQ
jgi:Protein of unknown function (DUF2726)